MNSVHIPTNKSRKVDCIDTCSNLCFEFAEPGEFSWTGAGREFNPQLPERRIEAGTTLGPFVAPNHDVEVNWKFISHSSKTESSGKIEVSQKPKSGEREAVASSHEHTR